MKSSWMSSSSSSSVLPTRWTAMLTWDLLNGIFKSFLMFWIWHSIKLLYECRIIQVFNKLLFISLLKQKTECMRFNLCISWWAREVRIRIINSISWRQSVPLNNKPTPICQIKCSSHLWVWNHVHIISNTVNEVVGHPKTTRKIVTSSIGSQEWIVIICLYSIVLNNVLKTRRFEVKNKSLNKI